MPKSNCSVTDCDAESYARGLCHLHYYRRLRTGKTESSRVPPEVRFWAKVEKTDTCWLWIAYKGPRGYGQFPNKAYGTPLAHRVAWILTNGSIPEDMTLDHLCRVKACVNPSHLELTTREENHARWAESITHCAKGHEFTDANTLFDGNGWRTCRVCSRETARQAGLRLRERRRAGAAIPDSVTHGKASTYTNYGCRCDLCRNALNVHQRESYRRRKVARSANDDRIAPDIKRGEL